uniref:L27-1 domain-containing protein n=1 Tax=Varanus komodoensis TaxID=61221 RepID=A0A8D2J9U8_VARKO
HSVRKTKDAQRAAEILVRYQGTLQSRDGQPLQGSIEKVVRIFRSELFQALLGKDGGGPLISHPLSELTWP